MRLTTDKLGSSYVWYLLLPRQLYHRRERLNRRTLKPKVVPSKYLPKLPHEADLGPSSRIPRTRQIQTSTTDKASPNNNEASEMFPLCENDGNGEDAQDIETVGALLALLIPKH
ncbi:hypothetical protein JTB14_002930 [Gonioctena quinquepunctata]|nr:hypothetical protein JTB14_002930 [Gonioctena quinquepunctata]